LHILGIALNYADDPRLQETRVLKPTWVTDGIYTLLRAVQRENKGGVLSPGDLGKALDRGTYPKSKHDFLLRLMEKFQLCFRLPGKAERYLVPELLDENQPDLKTLLDEPGLGFRYQYEVLPEGLLPRFIVQTQAHSEANPQWRWRTGVVLDRDECRAVVRADVRERRVDIHIAGNEPRRRGLLAIIREKFDEQHRDLKGLSVDERVPLPGEKDASGKDVTVSYRHLLELEADGVATIRPEKVRRNLSVSTLLNGVEADREKRKQDLKEILRRDELLAPSPRRTDMPISSPRTKGLTNMTTHQFNPNRLREVEELLEIEYDKYQDFRKEIALSTGNEKILLKQRLKRELVPQLRDLEKEYAELLAAGVSVQDIPDSDAEVILGEVVDAVASLEQQKPSNPPPEMIRLLGEIQDKLNEPGKSASAKLKVSLPIIPLLASYELELDTENFLTIVWQKSRDFFKRLVPK